MVLAFAGHRIQASDYLWHNPIANARLATVTEFDGIEQSATISRDGKFIAFLSDRDGHTDIWLTQTGSGQFHNLTSGRVRNLMNADIRPLGFSPDGLYVTYWSRADDAANGRGISVWAIPILGGEPRPYLEGAAEFDWTHDGSRVVYHNPSAGDPMFVADHNSPSSTAPLFAAPPGQHSHFPLWSPDAAWIYYVEGTLPDNLDIWRTPVSGGKPERITQHASRVTHPVFVDERTLLYLATDNDGSGPWLFSIDVKHRVPHRLSSGLDRYSSLAASADARRLVLTRTTPKRTLWRMPLGTSTHLEPSPARISLTSGSGRSPRLGPDYLLYVTPTGNRESIWKISNSGASTELWSEEGTQVIGGPAVAPSGQRFAVSLRRNGTTRLDIINADGTNSRIVTESLQIESEPAWEPDEQSITVAANRNGIPRLIRVPLNSTRPPALLVAEHSKDPAWAPDGNLLVYSGPDVGTAFSVNAVDSTGMRSGTPSFTVPRGGRHLKFLTGGNTLVFLKGTLDHKNVWSRDLQTGTERQLTNVSADFAIDDFDISADGREVVLERVQERSDIVLLDR